MCKEDQLLARIERLQCIIGCYLPAVDSAIHQLRALNTSVARGLADDLSFIQTDAHHVLNVTPIKETHNE